jgi:hypothetical protein
MIYELAKKSEIFVALPFVAVTTNVKFSHVLPPDPVDPDTSSTRSVQLPIEVGDEIAISGVTGFAGAVTVASRFVVK